MTCPVTAADLFITGYQHASSCREQSPAHEMDREGGAAAHLDGCCLLLLKAPQTLAGQTFSMRRCLAAWVFKSGILLRCNA